MPLDTCNCEPTTAPRQATAHSTAFADRTEDQKPDVRAGQPRFCGKRRADPRPRSRYPSHHRLPAYRGLPRKRLQHPSARRRRRHHLLLDAPRPQEGRHHSLQPMNRR